MTTKEFIKAVENLGYEARIDDEWVVIIYKNKTLAHIFTKGLYRMSSYYSGIDCGENAGTLFALIFQYACTPIEDREEEKKYLLLHKYVLSKNLRLVNLAYNKYKGTYRLINLKFDNDIYKVLFTEEEIEKLKEKLDTNLADFELIEVE